MQEFFQNFITNLTPWVFVHGMKIIVILVGAYIIRYFAGAIIDKIIRKAIVSKGFLTPEAEKKREDTLISIFEGTVKVIVWAAAILMIIAELGVNIGPLLAGAGIFGLAIGFGAQYIIRDFFTVHHVPNGEIKIASNLSKEFARVNMKIGIAYNTDIEEAIKVVNQVGKEMSKDSEWKDKIIKAPEFVRVDDLADSAMVIKISGEVKPLEQWSVLGELKKRIKVAFDKQGIEIPFPQIVVHQGK